MCVSWLCQCFIEEMQCCRCVNNHCVVMAYPCYDSLGVTGYRLPTRHDLFRKSVDAIKTCMQAAVSRSVTTSSGSQKVKRAMVRLCKRFRALPQLQALYLELDTAHACLASHLFQPTDGGLKPDTCWTELTSFRVCSPSTLLRRTNTGEAVQRA